MEPTDLIRHDFRDRLILSIERRWARSGSPARPEREPAPDEPLRPRRRSRRGPPPEPPPGYPAGGVEDGPLDGSAERRSGALMRVNHAGEVAAQALYRGQGVFARDAGVRRALAAAAEEERDHLDWCRQRLAELGAKPSRLDPLWWGGSFAIGVAAGAAGDASSLGFVAETERQVVAHLDRHLRHLPRDDHRSRAICRRMREDERRHGTRALEAGGRRIPPLVRALMRVAARVMTTTAYRI